MHTTSKYIGGHSDIIGGMLAVKDQELMKKLTANRELLGGIVAYGGMAHDKGPATMESGWRRTRPQPWRWQNSWRPIQRYKG